MQQIYRRTPWQSVISIKLQSNFIEIKFWHGCSPINLLHIFRKLFSQNTSMRLLLRYRPICNFVKKRLQHRCFLMNFAKKKYFSRKSSIVDVRLGSKYTLPSCRYWQEKLIAEKKIKKSLTLKWKLQEKKIVQRRIQNPVEHLRWNFCEKIVSG